jgi:hypothetical protein
MQLKTPQLETPQLETPQLETPPPLPQIVTMHRIPATTTTVTEVAQTLIRWPCLW